MKYLATIKGYYDSESRMFPTEKAAQQWLDENNNNLEKTTIIEMFNDSWEKIDRYIYTEGTE